MYKKLLRNYDNQLLSSCKTYRNKLCRIIDLAKQNYYHVKLSANKSNSRKVWELISNLTGNNQKVKSYPSKPKTGENNLITNQQEIAEAFYNFIAKIGSTLAEAVPSAKVGILERTRQPSQNLSNSFSVQPSIAEEVHAKTMQLNRNKANRAGDVETKFIKWSSAVTSNFLSGLFNRKNLSN